MLEVPCTLLLLCNQSPCISPLWSIRCQASGLTLSEISPHSYWPAVALPLGCILTIRQCHLPSLFTPNWPTKLCNLFDHHKPRDHCTCDSTFTSALCFNLNLNSDCSLLVLDLSLFLDYSIVCCPPWPPPASGFCYWLYTCWATVHAWYFWRAHVLFPLSLLSPSCHLDIEYSNVY